MPKISVAMCTYNGSRFIADRLTSMLAPQRLPDELVVCDDHSSDGTAEKLYTFKARAPFPVRVLVNGRNLGSTKNFEKAISLCEGDIIALSDQDDIWAVNRLDKPLQCLPKTSPLVGIWKCWHHRPECEEDGFLSVATFWLRKATTVSTQSRKSHSSSVEP
jgi:glycosyltransferase involved in cell wall biosynthesis